MMKFRIIMLSILAVSMLIVSCASGTDITKKNEDGSPIWTTEIPKSSKLLYGVGKAKLSNTTNSQDASYANASSDLAKKISVRIDEATSVYSQDAESSTKDAYESIKIASVSLTLKGVVTEDRWTESDGTVWTLVSVKVKNLPQMYEDSSRGFINVKNDEIEDIQKKLDALIAQLGDAQDAESLSLKSAAEKKASDLESEISHTLSSIKCDEVRDAIKDALIADGYTLDD